MLLKNCIIYFFLSFVLITTATPYIENDKSLTENLKLQLLELPKAHIFFTYINWTGIENEYLKVFQVAEKYFIIMKPLNDINLTLFVHTKFTNNFIFLMSAKAEQRGQSWPQIFNPNHLDRLYTRFRNPDVAIYVTLQPERMYWECLFK